MRRQRWPEHEGRRHGIEWALTAASYEDIQWMLKADSSSESLVDRLDEDRLHFREDWYDEAKNLGLGSSQNTQN